jgi:hypothetical protein
MRSSRPISFSFLFTGLLLFGCSATAAPTDPTTPADHRLSKPDSEGHLTLAVEGQAEVAPGLVLTLERVVADSRCPVDVHCVWAGEIRVAFALESPQTEAPRLEFELATTAPVAALRGLQFELLGATPEPRSTTKIAAADYRIALRVTPAPRTADGLLSRPAAGVKTPTGRGSRRLR